MTLYYYNVKQFCGLRMCLAFNIQFTITMMTRKEATTGLVKEMVLWLEGVAAET